MIRTLHLTLNRDRDNIHDPDKKETFYKEIIYIIYVPLRCSRGTPLGGQEPDWGWGLASGRARPRGLISSVQFRGVRQRPCESTDKYESSSSTSTKSCNWSARRKRASAKLLTGLKMSSKTEASIDVHGELVRMVSPIPAASVQSPAPLQAKFVMRGIRGGVRPAGIGRILR